MSAIRGTIQDGKVVFDKPTDLPDGTPVTVSVAGGEEYVGVGIREEDWPTTPEGIAALVAKMDQLQPFLTPEEEEAWHKARAADKAFQLSQWEKWCKEAGGVFE
jgi:hypothetical protein